MEVATPVSVRVKIFHAELKRIVDTPGEIRVEGTTVGECLADFVRRYPEAEPFMFDSQGRLLKRFHVFVNQESLAKVAFDQPVTDKDQLIFVALAVAG
jgi:hypothetical protein